jgi:peptidoglycan-N-acetylglucosamine deacetylase
MTLTEVRPERAQPEHEAPPGGRTREPAPAVRPPGPPRGPAPAPGPNFGGRRVAFAAAATVLLAASVSWATGVGARSAAPVADARAVAASVNSPAATPTSGSTEAPSPQPSSAPPQPSADPLSPAAAQPSPAPSSAAPSPTESPSASAEPSAAPSPAATPLTTGPPEVDGKKVVYLTFDDGPDPRWTPAILDALAAHNVRATFFVIGRKVEEHPDLAKRIVAEGHSLQNHTWSHPNLTELSRSDATDELARTNDVIKSVAGVAPKCLRPPEGATNEKVQELAGKAGQTAMLWSVDTKDWSNKSTDAIASIVGGSLQPGAVILMHDGGGDRSATVAALPAVLQSIANAGLAGAPLCA